MKKYDLQKFESEIEYLHHIKFTLEREIESLRDLVCFAYEEIKKLEKKIASYQKRQG